MGFGTSHVLVNCFDVVIFVLIGLMILMFSYLIQKKLSANYIKANKKIRKVTFSFFFGVPIRFTMESYILVLISSLLSIFSFLEN